MLSVLALPFHFSEAHFKVGSEGQVYCINRMSGTGSSIWALRPPCRCVPRLEAGPRHRSQVSADTAVSWGGRGRPALSSSPVSVKGGLTESEADSGLGERASLWVSSQGEKYWTKVQVLLGKRGSVCWAPTWSALVTLYPHTLSVSYTYLSSLHLSQLLEKFWRYRKTEENSTINSDS